MSDREQVKKIIDELPDYKISGLLTFLQGVQFDDDLEDDLYCEMLLKKFEEDDDPEKNKLISIEELAKSQGIDL